MALEGLSKPPTCLVWPDEDVLRLWPLLGVRTLARMVVCCRVLHRQFVAPVTAMRKADGGHRAELEQVLHRLSVALEHAAEVTGARDVSQEKGWKEAWEDLFTLQSSLHTEMRYVYGPDFEVKPGSLVSLKGTWLKPNTCFSWQLPDAEKLYLPPGVIMPVLQIGNVTDRRELGRHDWVQNHLRVWIRPPILRALEARRSVWFVYWPHWEHRGLVILAMTDTWLKRCTLMSGELQPFELVYVPKGLSVHLACEPSQVDEEWEKQRHQHVPLHRKVVLALPPLTVKQDHFDILVGQGEDSQQLQPV